MRFITQSGPNCWSVCVACILDLPEAEVPDFANGAYQQDQQGDDWVRAARRWLNERGMGLLVLRGLEDAGDIAPILAEQGLHMCRWIAGGPAACTNAPNADPHAVVYVGRVMEWDPEPSHMGLRQVDTAFILLALDPKTIRVEVEDE